MSASLVVTGLARLALVVLVAAATTLMPAADAGAQALVVGANFVIKSLDPGRHDRDDEQHGQPLGVRLAGHVRRRGPDHPQAVPGDRLDRVADDGKTYTFRLRRNVTLRQRQPADVGRREVVARSRANLKSNPAFFLNSVEEVLAPDASTVVLKLKRAEPVAPADPASSSLGVDRQQAGQRRRGATPAPDAKDKDKAERVPASPSPPAPAPTSLERYVPDQEVVLVRNPSHWRGAAEGRPHRDPQHHGAGHPEAPARARRPRHRHRARPGPDAGAPQRGRRHGQGEPGRHHLLRPDERQPADRRPVREPDGPAGGPLRPRLRRDPGDGGAGRRPAGRSHPHGRSPGRSIPRQGDPDRPRAGPRPPEGGEPRAR